MSTIIWPEYVSDQMPADPSPIATSVHKSDIIHITDIVVLAGIVRTFPVGRPGKFVLNRLFSSNASVFGRHPPTAVYSRDRDRPPTNATKTTDRQPLPISKISRKTPSLGGSLPSIFYDRSFLVNFSRGLNAKNPSIVIRT